MRAYDCNRGTTQIIFETFVANKDVIYCIAMAFFFTDRNVKTRFHFLLINFIFLLCKVIGLQGSKQ